LGRRAEPGGYYGELPIRFLSIWHVMLGPATVTVDLKSLKDFRTELTKPSPAAPIVRALKQWAARYRSFVRERFDTYSKGGGTWKPLALSTIYARRHRKSTARKIKKMRKEGASEGDIRDVANVSILRDTGTLFAALHPTFGKPGQVEEMTEFGVKVGFGGAALHPNGQGVTIADIASFHQFGHMPYLPQREILVPPDVMTQLGMNDDMEKALEKLQKETGND
jgi:hypothetical protein